MKFTATLLALFSMAILPALAINENQNCLPDTYNSLPACENSSDYIARQMGENPGYCFQQSPGVYVVCVARHK
jgi:hypothetical protein